ncbi:2-phosphosulfolactate phosphatase [Shivajiella indica]|uniref:Probable 2-phosphosulfolactate phosphatase n=1 Tax=Shivajiella indica TaxID=872115 RepID=A0ABW5BBL3_9BACT
MRKIETCLSPELIHLYEIKGKNVVIVDIFRATSTMISALANGVFSITPFYSLEECMGMQGKGYIIAGERDGKTAEGFELGNSPIEFLNGQYKGKKIAMTTTNGTHAIEKSKLNASSIIIGSFLNLNATAKYLSSKGENILILCAGWKGKFNLEDSLYAGALATVLKSNFQTECDTTIALESLYECHQNNLKKLLSRASHTKRLQNENIEADIDFCLTFNKYNTIGVFNGEVIISEKQ